MIYYVILAISILISFFIAHYQKARGLNFWPSFFKTFFAVIGLSFLIQFSIHLCLALAALTLTRTARAAVTALSLLAAIVACTVSCFIVFHNSTSVTCK